MSRALFRFLLRALIEDAVIVILFMLAAELIAHINRADMNAVIVGTISGCLMADVGTCWYRFVLKGDAQ